MSIPESVTQIDELVKRARRVMSGYPFRAHAGLQAIYRQLRALCSICVHDYLCGTCANWRAMR